MPTSPTITRPRTDTFRLPDGRTLGVHTLASGAGRTIVFCHAAPGAGSFDPDPTATADRDVTLIAVDRPGYGESDPVASDAWSTVDGAARDVIAVLDDRGIDRFSAAGWSGGGRIALALATLVPERVDRVAIAATPAPNEAVPWVPEQQQAGLEALKDLPPAAAHEALAKQLAPVVPNDPAADEALGLIGNSPADAEAMARPGVRAAIREMFAEAFAQGGIGMTLDIAGYGMRPWGFEPSEVAAKTLLVYGAKDPLAGSAHGRWWQSHLPDARLEMSPDAGHLVVVPQWARILSHLAPGR